MTRPQAVGAAALVVGAAMAMIVLGDSRAWSGSDAGGRAATVVAMDAAGSWMPDVGYWAERWDPDGSLHPLANTEQVGGHWVQATSVPFALAERALFAVAGFPGLLVLPVLGALLAAVGAGVLARWAGAPSAGPAFLAVGLTTPALFYAGDAWEHAPALGLATIALALAVAGRRWPSALAAGAGAGAAVALRAELAIYVATAVAVTLAVGRQRRRWLAQTSRVAAAATGLVVVVVANAAAERALLGAPLRSARAAGLARGTGASLAGRLSDAVLTSVGLVAESSAAAFGLGSAAAVALVLLGWWAVWGRPRVAVLAGGLIATGLAVGVAMRVDDGAGFVPGWLPAAPLAGAGLAALRPLGIGRARGSGAGHGEDPEMGERVRYLGLVAVVALPGVWLTSHVGLLEAQWGGRYLLLSGLLLTVAGVVALQRVRTITWASALLVTVAIAMAASGVVWHIIRTRTIAAVGAWVDAQAGPGTVVVSRWPHLGRETGAWYGQDLWLTADDSREAAQALEVAATAGAVRVVVLLPPGAAVGAHPRWEPVARRTRTVFGQRLAAVELQPALGPG